MARVRSIYSVKEELIKKSRESALAAIQCFNNPLITFKSETFIILMIVAWTYFLHAFYRGTGVEYRHFKLSTNGKRREFIKTPYGADRHWGLQECLDEPCCPLDEEVKNNLKFLLGIRHEIEHQMTNRIDNFISAKFQACCINYNNALKELFSEDYSLDKTVPVALQLFSFGEEQVESLIEKPHLPKNLVGFINDFETEINSHDSPKYSYGVIYIRKNVNHRGQADKAVSFISEGSEEEKEIHNVLVKNKQYKKLTQKNIVDMLVADGFTKFTHQAHRLFWQSKWKNAQERNTQAKEKGYGELVVNNQWLWYEETWLPVVKAYCKQNKKKFA